MGDAAGSCWTRPQTASTFSEGSGSRLMPRDSLLQPSLQRSALARICVSLHGPRLLERPTRLGAHCLQPFSERHGVESLPLHPSVTVRWLDHLSDYLSGSSVKLALCALLAWSKLNNLVDPLVSSPVIKLAWQGIRRTRMSRARPQKAPLSETIILAIYQLYWKRFEFVDPIDCLVETRTVGWLLLGFEIAPRVAELCNLAVCCYIPLLDGSAIILILEAKNNRELAACLSRVFIAPAMHHLRQFPSAAAFLRLVYIPLIVRLGVRRHPACTTNVDSVHRCQVCPKLFPTFLRFPLPLVLSCLLDARDALRESRPEAVPWGMTP